MATNYDKLRAKLEEMFMLDRADLDFGIYRIMNSKRDEILRFLDNDLLPQVRQVLQAAQGEIGSAGAEELQTLENQIRGAGMNPDDSPKVRELRAKYGGGDLNALEQEVFNHLYSFFRRYYDEGDFLSLRRYKEGVYAIPYEGEEVKLHWANADQYYIKTAEHFRDYTFKVDGDRRVHFKLVDAVAERDNNKATEKRVFILMSESAIAEQNGELLIRFEYRGAPDKRKQKEHSEEAVARILAEAPGDWKRVLQMKAATGKNPNRTVLEKHLTDYTARNTFDYFIHKDLGGFLRRELDFYIKNEVMHLDDIEHESCPKVEQYLAKVRALRRVAGKLIDFLAQLEDFQKKLWLKKKFVVDCQYLVTLDRVPEDLYPDIAANAAQREEWVRLFAIGEIKEDTTTPGYSVPLTVEFLKANQRLVLNTANFSAEFRQACLAGIENVDGQFGGLLIRSENFQALSLLQGSMQSRVRCIYIDPPYNTDASAIPYKNDYRHSSWATLMHDRARLLRPLLEKDGVLFVSIDKNERTVLEFALDSAFGRENRIEELIWVQNTNDGRSPTYSTNHEYVEVYAKHRATAEANPRIFREPKPGFSEVDALISRLQPDYPSIETIESELRSLYRSHQSEFRSTAEAEGLDWEEAKRNDPWNGIYQYRWAEYRDSQGRYVSESEAVAQGAKIWVYQESDWTIMSSEAKQSGTIYDPNHANYRFYQPTHPVTGKPCAMPSRGWKGTRFKDPAHPDRNSLESLMEDNRIAFGQDETKVPRQKRFLHEVDTNVAKSVFADYADGERETSALFGRTGVFLAPKHTSFVGRFLRQAVDPDSTVLDCFGGSGSTAHAVIRTNREEGTRLKFVLIEVNKYFDSVLVPRVQKALYAGQWLAGKPTDYHGVSCLVKVLRLESYEDSLNNLALREPNPVQTELLSENRAAREDYLLRYVLDVDTAGSPSLLNLRAFDHPFTYKLRVAADTVGETKEVNVDLVETFNWLLGLRVHTMDVIRGFHVVTGRLPGPGNSENGEKALIIWRELDENANEKLDEFFRKQAYNTLDQEFDVIYVNGDNNLQNLRKDDQSWKVRLIEEEFHRLMWDVEDI